MASLGLVRVQRGDDCDHPNNRPTVTMVGKYLPSTITVWVSVAEDVCKILSVQWGSSHSKRALLLCSGQVKLYSAVGLTW